MLKRVPIALAVLAAAVLAVAACGGAGSPAVDAGPVTVTLAGGEPVGGPRTITVKKGDTVRLTVESDTETDVHVHGYDVEQAAGPGGPAVFEFTASLDGIFDVEAHASGAEVAKLVVEP